MTLKNSLPIFAIATLTLPLGAQDAATPEIEPSGEAPSKAIRGYWAPNKESALEMMMEGLPNGARNDAAALAKMKAMAATVIEKMAFRFAEGETEMVSAGGVESAKWKAVSEDAKTGKLSVLITKEDGSTEEGEAIVGKDKMVLSAPGGEKKIALDRITGEEFKKRKAAAGAGGAKAP